MGGRPPLATLQQVDATTLGVAQQPSLDENW